VIPTDGKLLKERTYSFVHPHEKWGPYVAERGWGTVREDYSADGDAWSYFPHDHARSRAYRRAEDGMAGISDRFQVLLFAPAFWNGVDPILKERLFGLNSHEGNHGEDVKEIYYYLDAHPNQNYLKYLYKYPQKLFPYDQIVKENSRRGSGDPEYELIDTGAFDENRYFDIYIEYAKVDAEDICIRIEAINRGPQAAPLYILPHLWFRNQWSWGVDRLPMPTITLGEGKGDTVCLVADDAHLPSPKHLLFDYHLGKRYLYSSGGGKALFTNNDTNRERLWNLPNQTPFVKDGIHRFLVQGEKGAINPDNIGTKAAISHYFPSVSPGESAVVRLRFSPHSLEDPLGNVDSMIDKRRQETTTFYESIHPKSATVEEKAIQRQAMAGLIWSKQFYLFNVGGWIEGDMANPPPKEHKTIRNMHWRHMISMRIFSMPDKWEYPWFAAWDLTFQSLAYLLIDIEFAKYQLWLLLFDQFQHPNGAVPAYEWEFNDVNPPVQAWAALKIFEFEKKKYNREDFDFLEKCFHKLLLNFAWWVNKVDSHGNNVFEGGFLGMDNIGFLDRSEKLPEGCCIDQADGSGWVSLLCLNLMRIALTLAKKNPIYEGLGIKFFHHFIYTTAAMRKGYWRKYDMWDKEDAFFYSFIKNPDGEVEKLRVRSSVGIIPFFACDVWDEEELKQYPEFYPAYQWLTQKRSDLTKNCIQEVPHSSGKKHVFGLLNMEECSQFLKNIWNPEEFRSPFGMRSLSKFHEKNPARFHDLSLSYEPGEANEKIKGGNSNWRGPIWFPLNYLMIDTLLRLHEAYNDELKVQIGNEKAVNLREMAEGFAEDLIRLFKIDEKGYRPIHGTQEKYQNDPHFKDHILFYEHFHGDTGRGIGASHQTGWTALVANLIEKFRK
jgi:hypothetical protein